MDASPPYPDSRLDAIDVGIMEQLYEDGRRSNAKIAASLGVSVKVVNKRVERLLTDGVMEIVPVVNRERLGYTTEALLGISAEPAKAAAVVARLADFSEIPWVAHMIGEYNVLAEVGLRRPADMFDLVLRRIAEIPGVRSARAFPLLRQSMWIAGSWHQLGVEAGRGKSATQLDDLDESILGLLMIDGRRAAAEIARIAGVSTSTVTARLERLIQTGVCSVVGVLDPMKLGFTTHVFVGIQAELSRAIAIGEALTRAPQVFWVGHLAGWYDILIDVYLRDVGDLPGFLAEHIEPIEGVLATDAFWVQTITDVKPFSDTMALRPTRARRAKQERSATPESLPQGG